MSNHYVLSIDPGLSTGIVLGHYTETEPYVQDAFWQVEEGLPGFLRWHEEHFDQDRWDCWVFPELDMLGGVSVTVVCEQFVPLASARAFRVEELEPIRIEGAIEALDIAAVWQRAGAQVLAGGDTPAQRKKASDDLLRRAGLWTTGKMVSMPDSNDVNSAQKHAMHYMAFDLKHEPTMKAYFGGVA